MTIRIRRNKRLGETIVVDDRTLAQLTPAGVKYSPHATADERQRIERWLADRLAPLPDAEWPVVLPETYLRQEFVIASVLFGRPFRRPWLNWTNREERIILRAPAGTTLPSGAKLHGPDEPVSDEEREHAIREARRVGFHVPDDLDRHIRICRGDPWYLPQIHDAPIGFDSVRAADAAIMTLSSEHAIVWIRPADVAEHRWRSGIGIGSHECVVPLTATSPDESLTAALRLWRATICERVTTIHTARGGTLTGWGARVVPRETPRILRLDREGQAWEALRDDLARDPAPRAGLEAISGLYADGTPAV